ncbi:N-acetylglucosamine-6-phosphate deacetylase [Xanthomonas campestris]|uniref:N-acetylglucosamine-6-phosphate deacetylase n=1 Tax=Xanthomonas campestris pv. papavericola TaxID=487881 RepID=A0AAJ3CCE9_XANCA|nr:N-acetylglucosamine-6-phosphate deacetylase [Xanthomonas campestris]MEA9652810.1 N-acetylglucosamine-6-phosphate deacetylase [Xanthomonas campestris pv. raphani]MEA9656734.1 N-acetylglucosamine-6-phosphate deacetylase [Xanthomonas campestris pv. raphani]MEA9673354.1 N-acetylglucosamine-6-phosphate deacetylase [Xanthomonas campestris pv. raphani]MEA9753477.1 N-acetylglucosamine-6-phosphate deacetylase [Xanthomonas campestris pv. raphani]MEA9761559.1 N-acetylglucosamine-6-phosphate deacetylas
MDASPIQALCNARVLTDDGLQDGLAVLLDGAQIQAVVAADDARVAQAGTRVDLGGATLLPGFIDIQVNGGGGVLFNNACTPQALATIAAAHRRYGTTGMLPTLISDTAEVMAEAIAATRQAIAQGVPGVLGIHLEGPYLSPARKGTHDAQKFRVPDAHEIAVDTSLDNGVTLITLAPERVPLDDIRAFVAGGAVVFAGHTAATYEQARDGIAAGVSGFTHLYNAMSPLAGREPNAVGAALEDPAVWCGVIVDGVHVHPASLRVALAAKPRGKLLLVTDAMPMVGADSPSFDLYGETITAIDGVVRNAAGALAGSALDMATAVRNSVQWLGVDLAEAARMASTYPAQCIGLGERLGRIAPGYQADLVLVDADVQVLATWVAGQRD